MPLSFDDRGADGAVPERPMSEVARADYPFDEKLANALTRGLGVVHRRALLRAASAAD